MTSQAAYKPNLNLVQSENARSSKCFLPHINQGKRWLLNYVTGDEDTLDVNLPYPAFNLLSAQSPYVNYIKSTSTFLLSKLGTKENVMRIRKKYDTKHKCESPPPPTKKAILKQVENH